MSSESSKFGYVKSDTTVSSYDRLSAILIACITIIGFMTTILFLIWLTTDVDYSAPTQLAEITEIGDTGDEKPEGFEDDAFEPGVEEFPEVETPQLAQSIEAVTDAVSSVRANSEKVSGDAAQMGKGKGFGAREGGPGGGGGDGIPEFKRWKINYEAADIGTYKQQLSFFGIDIGVVRRDNDDVYRISDPAGKAEVIKSSRANEKSLYFAHIKKRMMRWDQAITRTSSNFIPTKHDCVSEPKKPNSWPKTNDNLPTFDRPSSSWRRWITVSISWSRMWSTVIKIQQTYQSIEKLRQPSHLPCDDKLTTKN